MIIYLAGGITGNLIADWKNIMDIYLISFNTKRKHLEGLINRFLNKDEVKCEDFREKKDMNIYLAGDNYKKDKFKISTKDVNVLESYFYLRKQDWMFPLIKEFNNFLLDSGAFTFISQTKNHKINWDNYIEEYADFINKNNIKLFFELDIDSIIGIKEVERLRDKLEKLTNKKCIPVWHISRGHDYWLKMIKEYNYVAIGGIAIKEIKQKHYPIFKQLIKEAHIEDCKVHGLGFTNLKGLTKYKFDSVDSTSWLSGNRFGSVYKFNGTTMVKIDKQKGQRIKNKETAMNNFIEWVKFCKYAEKYL